jgi:phosphomevalonate kinase
MTTIVSAPGKVLLAGGYLVLDPTYSGLVVATSSRFYCIIRPAPVSPLPKASSPGRAKISVRAGQFPDQVSTWNYVVSGGKDGLEVVSEREGKNKFVEITLRNALKVVVESLAVERGMEEAAEEVVKRIEGGGSGLEVVVLADNDFYSQRESVSALLVIIFQRCVPVSILEKLMTS